MRIKTYVTMKTFLKILVALGALVIIIFAVPIFTAKEYSVEKTVVVSKPKFEVFNYIKYLKNQNNYSSWALLDTEMVRIYSGTDGEIGFISAWESEVEDVGKGEQEIIKIEDGRRIDFELRFKEPFESKDHAYMETTELEGNKTQVAWGFNGKMPYPSNIMLLFMDFEKIIGDDLQAGLDKLKVILEE